MFCTLRCSSRLITCRHIVFNSCSSRLITSTHIARPFLLTLFCVLSVHPFKTWQVCSGCKTAGVRLSACSRCKGAFFCSKDCLKAAWKIHKKDCGNQHWLVQSELTLEQEISAARLVFDRPSDGERGRDGASLLLQRFSEFKTRMEAACNTESKILPGKAFSNPAELIAFRQEALWAFSFLRALHQEGHPSWKVLHGIAQDAIWIFQTLGNSHYGQLQYEKAQQVFEAQLVFCQERKLESNLPQAHENMGQILAVQSPAKAPQHFEIAR